MPFFINPAGVGDDSEPRIGREDGHGGAEAVRTITYDDRAAVALGPAGGDASLICAKGLSFCARVGVGTGLLRRDDDGQVARGDAGHAAGKATEDNTSHRKRAEKH